MTEQTEAAEVEALAWDSTLKRAVNFGIDDFRMGRKSNDGLARSIAEAVLASDWLAADRAAAEARGAERVLAAVEVRIADRGIGWSVAAELLDTARAAAMTVSSEKSSSLATRVPQDESQHTGGGS